MAPRHFRRNVRGLRRGLILAAVVALLAMIIYFAATPGSIVTEKTVSGALTNREALGGMIALVVLGCAALGLGVRDLL